MHDTLLGGGTFWFVLRCMTLHPSVCVGGGGALCYGVYLESQSAKGCPTLTLYWLSVSHVSSCLDLRVSAGTNELLQISWRQHCGVLKYLLHPSKPHIQHTCAVSSGLSWIHIFPCFYVLAPPLFNEFMEIFSFIMRWLYDLHSDVSVDIHSLVSVWILYERHFRKWYWIMTNVQTRKVNSECTRHNVILHHGVWD